ncbi:MAG: 50S ribosomal protein L11 methyltransferase [Pseudomonadota bacterium]
MGWQQLKMPLAGLDQERWEQALLDAGAVAITYTDAADQPILEPAPGEAPLWHDAVLTALFDDQISYEHIALTLLSSLSLPSLPAIDINLLPERDWERAWLDDFKPMQFGERLWVCPHAMSVSAEHATIIKLDPGLAFGTGTHATTALCLSRLDSLALEGATVLDYGCGSGILAIASLLLGAASVDAVDIDPQALTATLRNAADNDVAEALHCALPNDWQPLDDGYDVVLANILAQPLMSLAETLSRTLRDGGVLLLSGILEDQADAVMQKYDPFIEFAQPKRQDGWVLLEGARR